MGKNKVMKLEYPERCLSTTIVAVETMFTDSFKEILERSGQKRAVAIQFRQRLDYLAEKKTNCIQNPAWFESCKGYKNIYAIKIKGTNLNIRIPFIFCTHRNQSYAVLLIAFQEKKAATAKTESYKKYIGLVQPIIDNFEEALEWDIN